MNKQKAFIFYFLFFLQVCSSQHIMPSFNIESIKAQSYRRHCNNSFICEVLGNGYGFFSVSYERALYSSKIDVLRDKASVKIFGRIGLGFGSRIIDSIGSYNFPIEISMIYGKRHNIELGIGITPCIGKEVTQVDDPYAHFNTIEGVLFCRLGYRCYLNEGVIVRVAPLLQFPSQLNWETQLTLGLSVGYGF